MTDLTCEGFRRLSAEVALGVAEGRDRADALAHLEHCPACRSALRQLGDVADAVSALAPAAEPPAGFESRLLVSLGRARSPGRVRRPRSRRVLQVAAAAAVAVLFGASGWLIGDRHPHTPAVTSGRVVTAELVADHLPVGDVVIETGAEPWLSMAVRADLGAGRLRCQLRTHDGRTLTVGSFRVSDGYAYWAAPVPSRATPVDGAQIVDASGHVLASAAFPSLRV